MDLDQKIKEVDKELGDKISTMFMVLLINNLTIGIIENSEERLKMVAEQDQRIKDVEKIFREALATAMMY